MLATSCETHKIESLAKRDEIGFLDTTAETLPAKSSFVLWSFIHDLQIFSLINVAATIAVLAIVDSYVWVRRKKENSGVCLSDINPNKSRFFLFKWKVKIMLKYQLKNYLVHSM